MCLCVYIPFPSPHNIHFWSHHWALCTACDLENIFCSVGEEGSLVFVRERAPDWLAVTLLIAGLDNNYRLLEIFMKVTVTVTVSVCVPSWILMNHTAKRKFRAGFTLLGSDVIQRMGVATESTLFSEYKSRFIYTQTYGSYINEYVHTN